MAVSARNLLSASSSSHGGSSGVGGSVVGVGVGGVGGGGVGGGGAQPLFFSVSPPSSGHSGSPKKKRQEVLLELLQSCRKPSQSSANAKGRTTSGHAGAHGEASYYSRAARPDHDRQVDVLEEHVAIAANKGFSVYVISLKQQGKGSSSGQEDVHILSRHEFSQVKTLRFVRTPGAQGKGKWLVVIQEDGEIAIWNWRQRSAFEEGHRWQMVNRMPPTQGQSQLLSHAIVAEEEKLTILCLKQLSQQQVFGHCKVSLECLSLEIDSKSNGHGDGDMSPRHRKQSRREILGEILGADALLCPAVNVEQPPTAGTAEAVGKGGKKASTLAHFWVVCSERSIAFLWDLKTRRCVRKINLQESLSHLFVNNPSGDLMWITQSGDLCMQSCEERTPSGDEESVHKQQSGSPGSSVVISNVHPGLPNDQQIVNTVSVGPFLWLVTTPFVNKIHQKQSVTVLAFHMMSGTCVGKQTLTPSVGSSGIGASGIGLCHNLILQSDSLRPFLVIAGGNLGGMWECQLKVPSAMASVLSNILQRLSSTHNTGGGNDSSRPSAQEDLNLLNYVLDSELPHWGPALQQQKLNTAVAQIELVAKLCNIQEVEKALDKTSLMPALLVQSRSNEEEIAKAIRVLIDKGGEVGGGHPRHSIHKNTVAVLKKYLDQIESRGEDKDTEEGAQDWDSNLYSMGKCGASYHAGDRVRLCTYFFQTLLSSLGKDSLEDGQNSSIKEMHKIFTWWFVSSFTNKDSSVDVLVELEKKVEASFIHDFAKEIALIQKGREKSGGGDKELYLDIAFEITSLMLYLVLPTFLVDFVLAFGQIIAGNNEVKERDSQSKAVRDYSFRAACVLPALHIHGSYDIPPKHILEVQVQTQAKLYCMAGHPLCALHVLCRLESTTADNHTGELDARSFQNINDLLLWMRNFSGSKDDLQVLSILVEHVVIKMLRSKDQALNAEAGLLLRTLNKKGQVARKEGDDTNLDSVVENIIQESISSLHKVIV